MNKLTITKKKHCFKMVKVYMGLPLGQQLEDFVTFTERSKCTEYPESRPIYQYEIDLIKSFLKPELPVSERDIVLNYGIRTGKDLRDELANLTFMERCAVMRKLENIPVRALTH